VDVYGLRGSYNARKKKSSIQKIKIFPILPDRTRCMYSLVYPNKFHSIKDLGTS
jgi:hypothetical protein